MTSTVMRFSVSLLLCGFLVEQFLDSWDFPVNVVVGLFVSLGEYEGRPTVTFWWGLDGGPGR